MFKGVFTRFWTFTPLTKKNNESILTKDKITRQTDRHNNSFLDIINKKLEALEAEERAIVEIEKEKDFNNSHQVQKMKEVEKERNSIETIQKKKEKIICGKERRKS